jgi:phosphoesterase RecJ-like protein
MSVFQPVIDFINRHERFIITAHETPDGDAIGCECAMARALRQVGREVLVFNADPTPRKFRFVDVDNIVQVLEHPGQLPDDLERWALLMLDTSDVRNIGQVAGLVLPHVREHFIIDHHENEGDILAGNFVQKSASSTAEILHPLFAALGVTIDYPIALALYTAIVYDTGSFIYPKTTALTFGIARDLVERGVEPNAVYANVYESNSISALVLHARVLATLELALGNHVALLTMRREMIAESGGIYEEADLLINIPLQSEDVRVSVFFKENTEGLMRCSMRSKGSIDVAEIAQRFGGGGHRTAAGFKCQESLEETRRAVLSMLAKYFP